MTRWFPILGWMMVAVSAMIGCAPVLAASFDCRRPANAAERLICTNRDLSQLDERLGLAYKRYMSSSAQPYEDQIEHTKWLAERDACKDSACLQARYAERIAQVRGQSSEWLAFKAAERSWVASDGGEGVCQSVRAQIEALGVQDFAARGSERSMGTLCPRPGQDCVTASRTTALDDLVRAGAPIEAPAVQELLIAGAPVTVAQADLDNDGVDDMRLAQRAGEAQCERSVVLLGSAQGKLRPESANGYERLSEQPLLCGRGRVSVIRLRDVNYVAAIGEQRVYVLRGAQREGLQPVCGFKRRWTEQEKRAAYAVLKRNPDLLRSAHILRPEKERAADGRRVWEVQVRCRGGPLLASFAVDPRTLDPQTVVAPGSKGSCDAPRVAQEPALPAVKLVPRELALYEPLTPGPWLEWQGLP